MPNIKSRPTSTVPQDELIQPKIYPDEFKHNLIDLEVTPPNSIVVNIQGYPVVGDWYNARIGMDQEPDGFNSGQTTPHQAYRLIKNMRLKLNSPFDYNIEASHAITDFTTVAKIYVPGFVPMAGDAFLMEIGNGRLGRFEVERVRPLSIYQNRAYEFELRLMELATTTVVAAMDAKVVQTLYFIEEFILNGQNPLLTQEAFNSRLELKRQLTMLSKQYIAENYSHQHSTLLVPEQDLATYDPYVVTCILNLLEHDAHPLMKKIRDLNVDGRQTRNYVDLYTVLLNCDIDSLPMCFTDAGIINTRTFSGNYSMASIRFSQILQMVYPVNKNHGSDRYYDAGSSGEEDARPLHRPAGLYTPINGNDPVELTLAERNYVFPNSFYALEDASQAALTKLTMDYLENKAIDTPTLTALIAQRKNWSSVERFYYEPILIILIKASLKGIGPW